jgi:hypothetical protein
MDLSTIIAAAPVIKRAWKITPPALRVPILVAGAAVLAYKWLTDRGAAEAEAESA